MTDEKRWSGLWSEPKDDDSVYGEKLMEGDKIYLLGVEGTVTQECGAWGWGSPEHVPWEDLEDKIPHNNHPDFCHLGKIKDSMLCGTWVCDNPEKTEKIIMEWSAKNPPFTNAAKFKEVFGFDFQETFGCYYSEWLNAEYKEDGEQDDKCR